ncbi:YihY/virulence factor BrkB family protein [Mucilaginibacter ginkgonis]|uniref:YihY/virulence factor BrkB family protein n=1 Tax=Mucilaginibacter ginkgonis TaxID=2682091 RepID=A0A6I4I4B7_9SPHI|nr:YihY/virulence factor BrkB family protein [Mucilaginibacter ginkgonis]QQL48839.1 YihY/virulence factor BrkB family protein [Mucilaginibacter ginkgonis]
MKKIFTKEYLNRWWCILKATFMGFSDDNGLKFSASLAYYTVFSLAPLLILVISLAGLFLGQDAITNSLYPQIKGYVGADAAAQIQDMLKNLELSGKTGTAIAIGVVTLMMGASSIFIEIQDSLNTIWRVKAKPKKSWLKLIQNRFISFSLIISLGFLFLVTMAVNLLILALSNRLQHFLPGLTIWVVNGINLAIGFIVISTLFGIIFKVLPDVKIKWSDVRSGAFFTALLFMLGKYVIGLYIEYSAKTSTYGAAGSIIVILLWIYYTAAILYIGAEFTQVYAEANGSHIEPAEYAVHIKQTEVEQHVDVLPPQNPELQNKLNKPVEGAAS